MSLLLATLIPGIILILLGALLVMGPSGGVATLRAFPRSQTASYVLFGGASIWFLYNIWHLSSADFGDYKVPLFIFFAIIAVLAFKCVPDFLPVRGAAALMLLAAGPLLRAAFMEYQYPQRLLMVTAVYLGLSIAIWLGAQPWRLRDFFEWLFRVPGRSRGLGLFLLVYGLLLTVVSFTY